MIYLIEDCVWIVARIVACWKKVDTITVMRSWFLEKEKPTPKLPKLRTFKPGEEIGFEGYQALLSEYALHPFFSPCVVYHKGKSAVMYGGAIITGECPHCGFPKNYHYGCPRCYSLR